jgi:hypothetical protein
MALPMILAKNAALPAIFSVSDGMAQSSFTFARLHSHDIPSTSTGLTSIHLNQKFIHVWLTK